MTKTINSTDYNEAKSEPLLQPVLCQDETGKRYTVIAYQPYPFLRIVDHALDDGTAVRSVGDHQFEIEVTGTILKRCP